MGLYLTKRAACLRQISSAWSTRRHSTKPKTKRSTPVCLQRTISKHTHTQLSSQYSTLSVPQIEVTFDVNADGILKVTATEKGGGKTQDITISNQTATKD